MSKDDVVVAAFTEEQAEKLTSVSKRQLQHWDRTDFFVPSMAFQDR
jgi:DNA-binding transcriptional MerR regulator